jgi:AraC family transcriptional activator of pobA
VSEAREPVGEVAVAHRTMLGGAARHAPVTHAHAALAFYTDGHARMELDGRWELAPGDVLIVPAGAPHRRLAAKDAAFWGLGFCVPCFASLDGAAELLAPFERVRDGAAAVVSIPGERQELLASLFRELEARTHAPSAVQRSLLTLVLDEVGRAARGHAGPPAGGSGVVVDALRYIERHCLRPLTLAEVAAAVGRSPAHVTTALRRATGRSAVAWIVAGRMAEARRRLLHSDEHVDVIAERVGYADPTHFIRMFRREHGTTPAAWRASLNRATRPARPPR